MRRQCELQTEFLCWIFLLLLLTGCGSFEFSPNQVSDKDSPRDLNSKNLIKLFANPTDDTVTVVFVGDSQRWYDELDRFVEKVNTLDDVDLVLLAGDVSDFGLLQEFEWVTGRLGHPLDIGIKSAYHFGDQFYLNWPERFPRGYYWWKSALRLHLATESSVTRELKNAGSIKAVTGYIELNTNDLYLVSYVLNPTVLAITDIIKIGCGIRIHF